MEITRSTAIMLMGGPAGLIRRELCTMQSVPVVAEPMHFQPSLEMCTPPPIIPITVILPFSN